MLRKAGEDLLAELRPLVGPDTALMLCDLDGNVIASTGPGPAGTPAAIQEAIATGQPTEKNGVAASPVPGAGAVGATGPQAAALAHMAARVLADRLRLTSHEPQVLVHDRTLQELVETISDGCMAIDREGRIVYLNRNGAEILGVDVNETVGRKVTDTVDFVPKVLTVLETGRGWVDREFFIRVGKRNLHLIKSAIPVKNAAGEVTGVIDTFREIRKVRKLVTDMVGARASFAFDDIVYRSEEMRQAVALAKRVAASNSTALLQGESGTGKELFAQAIHNASPRSAGPFITVDCAAIPRELVESELFGYVEGSFTGARKGGRPGKFELAHGGTIFLDEIGEMPLDLQAKLLRVLQSRTVTRVGGSEPIPVDIRVIAATNRNLADEVRQRNFREDLFFRLNVVPLTIPPLRKRRSDIDVLLSHLLRRGRNRVGKSKLEFSPAALELLQAHPWPGNVRELENVVERALTLADGEWIEPVHLPAALQGAAPQTHPGRPAWGEATGAIAAAVQVEPLLSRPDWERAAIQQALRQTGDNIVKAAKLLGMARSTFYAKLKAYGMR